MAKAPIKYPIVNTRSPTWRERCRGIIAQVLAETAGQPEKEIRRALKLAYPWGERAHYPYKAWLLEVKAQRFPKPRKGQRDPVPGDLGLTLFDLEDPDV